MRFGQEASNVFLPLHRYATFWRPDCILQFRINKLWLPAWGDALWKTSRFVGLIGVNMGVNADNNNKGKDAQIPPNIAYISQMLSELRYVAKVEGADMLLYLIEMAYIEAEDIKTGRRKLSVSHIDRNPPLGMPI
ncbi:hypothetical protein [Agrobacterium sp. CG674]